MNINFLYTVLTGLCFTVKFDFDENSKQHYLFFSGLDTSTHLFRENSTLTLVLQSNYSFYRYQSLNLTNPFTFTWEGFRVNDKAMKLIKSTGNIPNFQFNGYTFVSPYLEVLTDSSSVEYIVEESIFQCQDINYGVFLAIALAVGLIMRSDNIIARTLKIFSKVLKSEIDESVYVEIDNISTTNV